MNKIRLDNLDLIRGILILYVVLYHMSSQYGIINFQGTKSHIIFDLLSFFMAPFYFFSGFLFSNKREFKEYVTNKIHNLLIPYLFWTAVSLPIFYISNFITTGEIHFISPFKSLIGTLAVSSNTPLWFFISLFFVNIIYYCISKYKNINIIIFISFLFALLVHNRIQIFSWGNISLGLVYFHLGYTFAKYAKADMINKKTYLIGAIIVFILIFICNTQNLAFVTLYQRKGLFLLNLPYSIAACYILWYCSIRIRKISFVNWVGRHSLVLFASHQFILIFIYDPNMLIQTYLI